MTAIHSKPPGDLSTVAREASEGGRRMTEKRNCSTILRVRRLLLVLLWCLPRVGGGRAWRPAESSGALSVSCSARATRPRARDRPRPAAGARASSSGSRSRATPTASRRFVRRVLPGLALCCALVLGAHAIHYGTFTAGGSDSWGYVSQAYGWARGTLAARGAVSDFGALAVGRRAHSRRSDIARARSRTRWSRRTRPACR